MGLIYQLLQQEEQLLVKSLDTMVHERNIQPSSRIAGSSIFVLSKQNGCGRCLCIDSRHQNDFTKKDRTPLLNLKDVQGRLNGATVITKVDLKSAFHWIRMALE